MANCKYCGTPCPKEKQIYCNSEHWQLYKTNGPLIPPDPVIEFLSKITFNTNIFDEISAAHNDPVKWEQYFKTPDVFVYNAARSVLGTYDPNINNPKSQKDHDALYNLLGWFMIKCITDPVWFSYLGWMNRFIAAHANTSSYYPLKYHDRFNPNHFFTRDEEVVIPTENTKFTDPAEVFKWRGPKT